MKCDYACQSEEHTLARRDFLGGMLAGTGGLLAGGMGALAAPASTQKLMKDQKRVLVVYMSGGLSQLESWDPKPKTDTGGPFRAIPTAVPGVHISRTLAEDGPAHGQAGPHPQHQHQEQRPRQRPVSNDPRPKPNAGLPVPALGGRLREGPGNPREPAAGAHPHSQRRPQLVGVSGTEVRRHFLERKPARQLRPAGHDQRTGRPSSATISAGRSTIASRSNAAPPRPTFTPPTTSKPST